MLSSLIILCPTAPICSIKAEHLELIALKELGEQVDAVGEGRGTSRERESTRDKYREHAQRQVESESVYKGPCRSTIMKLNLIS